MAAAPEQPVLDTRQAQGKLLEHEDEKLPVVETPTSPFSSSALSRFEFEAGKANDGTKILMVEWDTSVGGGTGGGDWEVSWEGKTTVLPIRDTETEVDSNLGSGSSSRRVYFLLPPGAPIPPLVSITQLGRDSKDAGGSTIRTKPMPAIFPAELVANGDQATTAPNGRNKRGVLHTIWAKKRLRELRAEIEMEMRDNVESVGLEMALQEQQWIVDHFGLEEGEVAGAPQPTRLHIPQNPQGPGPASPRSPIGGRLGAKLKGLTGLATSPTELAAAAHAAKSAAPRPQQGHFTSLSPGASDVAVSSFGSMFPQGRQTSSETVSNSGGGIGSLDAMIGSTAPRPTPAADDVEEDLFALPMSPRSPEMKRSPFSIL
ncbi:hypothetical protein NKR19_g976 [Coniochaeta hoffmannii]|uniref:Uncharacterized protein n=1 Tax=Coniochaeta hoffmannii TaxID=91930 RepID=A0AA38SL45_9PEZI|nr:hypothetical protein NKR19_g976 [Coniochaeta hoffmannii]